MEAYQQRVVTERNDLHTKRAALGEFLRSPEYAKVPDVEKKSLQDQHEVMVKYENILDHRIDLYKAKETRQPTDTD